MPYYKKKNSGTVICVDEKTGGLLISLWEEVSEADSLKTKGSTFTTSVKSFPELTSNQAVWMKRFNDKKNEGISSEDLEVFENVAELRKNADTSKNATTKRGAEYSYTDGSWKKM